MSDNASMLLAVGTYTQPMPHVNGQGKGIHLLRFYPQEGRLEPVSVTEDIRNPSYLTVTSSGLLYSVRELDAAEDPGIDIFRIDKQHGTLERLQRLSLPGSWPCHVRVDETLQLMAVANYLSGELLVFRLGSDGLPSDAPSVLRRSGKSVNAERQEASHAHGTAISVDKASLYLADLGIDQIVRYPLNGNRIQPQADLILPAVPGAGPRHIAFTPDGCFMLVNFELSSSVALFSCKGEKITRRCEISTLPLAWQGENGVGGMHIHPNGRFVYVSNRGHDSVFAAEIDVENGALRPLGQWPAGGKTPRDFTLSPCGNFLLCAAQDEPVLRVFRIDTATGALTRMGDDFTLHNAVCLQFIA